ncbi:ATP-binding protein [Patescibacteria group bacterium]|nr:ATP-binding protein [Patescibacteria group bacterium]
MNIDLKDRAITSDIIKQIDNDLVLILIGARQSGKTYILKLLTEYIKKRYSENKILYFDLEKPDILDNFLDYKMILNFLSAQGVEKDKMNFILLDEFQKMPAPTKTLKIIHDHYPFLKIIATGSSSLDIYKKLREESMVGRKRVFTVFPLSFEEYLSFTEFDDYEIFKRILKKDIDPSAIKQKFISSSEECAVWGAYPKVVLSNSYEEKRQELAEIYQSYLNKDVIGFLNAEDAVSVNKLVSLLSVQIGNLFNQNEIAKIADVSRYVLAKYLFVLDNTFIIKQLLPFYTNKQKEVVKMPKIYFIDTGLRNFAVKNFNSLTMRQDAGSLMENFVFLELLKGKKITDELRFWRTPHRVEVDFIILGEANKIIPVEVKYKSFSKSTIPSGLKAFINIYSPKQAFVLTKDFYAVSKYNKCEIYFLPVFLTAKIFTILNRQ